MHRPGRPAEEGSVGCAVGDYDNDGELDLFVTSYGVNILYRNKGDGRFEDVAPHLGLAEDNHAVGAAWGDYDNDGWLDLFEIGRAHVCTPVTKAHLVCRLPLEK